MFHPHSTTDPRRQADGSGYTGPERRARSVAGWTQAALDELDYGILLLDADAQLLLANHAARAELDAHHPLQLLGRQLRARWPQDVAPLHDALASAAARRLRRLLPLGRDQEHRVTVAIVPLQEPAPDGRPVTMVTLGKRHLCERLSVQWYAQVHGLTPAEARVLGELITGKPPRLVAQERGVDLSTVRTQVSQIRAKTGTRDLRHLVACIALLPPMVSALRA
jgi:DNA-binding CsgD family transcriptional regulator